MCVYLFALHRKLNKAYIENTTIKLRIFTSQMGKKNHVIVVVIGAKGPLKAASINKSLPIFQRAVRENVLQPEHPGITHALFGLLSLTAEAVQTAVI